MSNNWTASCASRIDIVQKKKLCLRRPRCSPAGRGSGLLRRSGEPDHHIRYADHNPVTARPQDGHHAFECQGPPGHGPGRSVPECCDLYCSWLEFLFASPRDLVLFNPPLLYCVGGVISPNKLLVLRLHLLRSQAQRATRVQACMMLADILHQIFLILCF